MAEVSFAIQGDPGKVTLSAFVRAIQNELRVLGDLDAALSRKPKGSLHWFVTGLSCGSLAVTVESRSRDAERDVGPETVSAFVQGLDQIEQGGATPPYFSESIMEAVQKIVRMIGRDGAVGFEVATPLVEKTVTLSAKASANIEELIPTRYNDLGSVEGRMEQISIHGAPRFIVYHARTQKAVTCRFDRDQWLDTVKEALGYRVNVSG